MLSQCCSGRITYEWGGYYCVECGGSCNEQIRTTKRIDLMAWLFPPEAGPRPTAGSFFLRYGKRLEVAKAGTVRGHPDGWSWIDA